MKQFCFVLDLKEDEALIKEYEACHQKVWPEVLDSIRSAGIEQLEIYRFANRLCMMMQTNDAFSFEQKAFADAANEKVQAWEKLMWKYQQAIPGAEAGSKWVLMDKIFDLKEAK